MKQKTVSIKEEKKGKVEKPVKKKALKKAAVVKKANPKKDKVITKVKKVISLSKEDMDAIDLMEIMDEIYGYVEKNIKKIVILMSNQTHVIVANSTKLNVNNIVNNSLFQPYETNKTDTYCFLSIIQIGEQSSLPPFVEGIKNLGARLYKIMRVDQVVSVLESM